MVVGFLLLRNVFWFLFKRKRTGVEVPCQSSKRQGRFALNAKINADAGRSALLCHR